MSPFMTHINIKKNKIYNYTHFCRLFLKVKLTNDLFEKRLCPTPLPLVDDVAGLAESIVVLLFHRLANEEDIFPVRGNGDALGLDESLLGDSLNRELLLPLKKI